MTCISFYAALQPFGADGLYLFLYSNSACKVLFSPLSTLIWCFKSSIYLYILVWSFYLFFKTFDNCSFLSLSLTFSSHIYSCSLLIFVISLYLSLISFFAKSSLTLSSFISYRKAMLSWLLCCSFSALRCLTSIFSWSLKERRSWRLDIWA